MANMNPTDWAAYYKANRNDGGALQNVFIYEDELAEIAKNRLDDTNGLTSTIAGSGGANVLLVPSERKGLVEVVHQGFTCSLRLGGEQLLTFVHGNLSGSPFKTLDPWRAVERIGAARTVTRTAVNGAMSPKPESYFGISNDTEFGSLPAEDCDVLQDRLNHLFIHPRHFISLGGPKSKRAMTFAMALIEELNEREDDADDQQEKTAIEGEKKELGALIASLWAAENSVLSTNIPLVEIPENPQLNQ
jgi:hypothetical protein